MDSVSEASKVGDMLCARFFREIRFVRKAQGRFPKKPPAGSILHTRITRNTFATTTDSSALYRSCAGWRKDEEKVMEEKLGEKNNAVNKYGW